MTKKVRFLPYHRLRKGDRLVNTALEVLDIGGIQRYAGGRSTVVVTYSVPNGGHEHSASAYAYDQVAVVR